MPHRRRVREEISVFAIFLLTGFILCTGLTPPTWAQSSGDGFSDTLQRYAPEIIDQLNCKPYDLDCQNRARMRYYQKMSEDNARGEERAAKEERREKERAAREQCADRDDDRAWALCMKRYLGE